MTNTYRTALLAVAALCGLGGCQSQQASTAWTEDGTLLHKRAMPNGEARWEHQFVYHPQEQVYYEPYTQMYYWFEDNTWMEGGNLPRDIRLSPDHVKFVSVMLPKPWMNHDSVAARHHSQTGTLAGSLAPANFEMEPHPLFAPAMETEMTAETEAEWAPIVDAEADVDVLADADAEYEEITAAQAAGEDLANADTGSEEIADTEPIEVTGVNTDGDIND